METEQWLIKLLHEVKREQGIEGQYGGFCTHANAMMVAGLMAVPSIAAIVMSEVPHPNYPLCEDWEYHSIGLIQPCQNGPLTAFDSTKVPKDTYRLWFKTAEKPEELSLICQAEFGGQWLFTVPQKDPGHTVIGRINNARFLNGSVNFSNNDVYPPIDGAKIDRPLGLTHRYNSDGSLQVLPYATRIVE